jgi:hypothetical protein
MMPLFTDGPAVVMDPGTHKALLKKGKKMATSAEKTNGFSFWGAKKEKEAQQESEKESVDSAESNFDVFAQFM